MKKMANKNAACANSLPRAFCGLPGLVLKLSRTDLNSLPAGCFYSRFSCRRWTSWQVWHYCLCWPLLCVAVLYREGWGIHIQVEGQIQSLRDAGGWGKNKVVGPKPLNLFFSNECNTIVFPIVTGIDPLVKHDIT